MEPSTHTPSAVFPTPQPIERPAAPIPEQAPDMESGRSEALGRSIRRLQQEEQEGLDREEQDRLARLREKARLD